MDLRIIGCRCVSSGADISADVEASDGDIILNNFLLHIRSDHEVVEV